MRSWEKRNQKNVYDFVPHCDRPTSKARELLGDCPDISEKHSFTKPKDIPIFPEDYTDEKKTSN